MSSNVYQSDASMRGRLKELGVKDSDLHKYSGSDASMKAEIQRRESTPQKQELWSGEGEPGIHDERKEERMKHNDSAWSRMYGPKNLNHKLERIAKGEQ